MKKIKLKEGIKTFSIVALVYLLIVLYLFLASARIESIENNPEAYTERSYKVTIKK